MSGPRSLFGVCLVLDPIQTSGVVCLVPGSFWGGYILFQVPSWEWVCLVHPSAGTPPGKVHSLPRKVHPWKVHPPGTDI